MANAISLKRFKIDMAPIMQLPIEVDQAQAMGGFGRCMTVSMRTNRR